MTWGSAQENHGKRREAETLCDKTGTEFQPPSVPSSTCYTVKISSLYTDSSRKKCPFEFSL